MPRGFTLNAWVTVAPRFRLTSALLVASHLLASTNTLLASDLQRSTDAAAVQAKKDLCVALNRGEESPELRDKFFQFYEGKIVSAYRLQPETFAAGQIGPLPPFRVVQVLGPNELLASTDDGMFKLRDISTDDVADGQVIHWTEFFIVRATETYDTVAGSTNTVYVLEPARDNMAVTKPSRVYPWFNQKNEPFVNGEFKVIDGSQAVFLVEGRESRVTLSKFTRGDRALMRILMERYPQDTSKDAEGKQEEKPQDRPKEKPPARPIGID